MFADALDITLRDIVAGVVSIIGALGGVQGIRKGVQWFNRLVELAETLTARTEAIERHSVRIESLENGLEQLRHMEGGLMAVLESKEYGWWISDNDGKCLWVNPALIRVSRATHADQLLGLSWRDLVHPDDRERVFAKWADFVRGDRRVFLADYRFQGDDGLVSPTITAYAIRPVVRGQRVDLIHGWIKEKSHEYED